MIREALSRCTSLGVPVAELGDDDDIFDAGLSSFDWIILITELEDTSGVEFSETELTRENFSSIKRIQAVLGNSCKKEMQA
jgi:acyl carrier protein